MWFVAFIAHDYNNHYAHPQKMPPPHGSPTNRYDHFRLPRPSLGQQCHCFCWKALLVKRITGVKKQALVCHSVWASFILEVIFSAEKFNVVLRFFGSLERFLSQRWTLLWLKSYV